jgi:adenylylsulfate kinase-like enzyme
MIYWFTGQPGAGKTTLAEWVQSAIPNKCVIVDGDDIRKIFDNKDYSEQGRRKNIELAQNIAHFLHEKGNTVLVALVSPYKDQRDAFKVKMGDNLVELYVHCDEIRGREQFHVSNYEPPTEYYVDVNTTNKKSFDSYQEIRLKLNI